jgi:hypothetical protein
MGYESFNKELNRIGLFALQEKNSVIGVYGEDGTKKYTVVDSRDLEKESSRLLFWVSSFFAKNTLEEIVMDYSTFNSKVSSLGFSIEKRENAVEIKDGNGNTVDTMIFYGRLDDYNHIFESFLKKINNKG